MPIQHEGPGTDRASISAAKLDAINAALDAGRTVYLCTHTRATEITAKVRDRFDKAGHPVLKVGADGSLYLASGRKYVCADFCAIRVSSEHSNA